jgi:hypothetical protein
MVHIGRLGIVAATLVDLLVAGPSDEECYAYGLVTPNMSDMGTHFHAADLKI